MVVNTISILSPIWCVPRSYVCTINMNTYPVSTCINDSLAITGSVARDVLHMIHIDNYFPIICLFNYLSNDYLMTYPITLDLKYTLRRIMTAYADNSCKYTMLYI